MRFFFIFLLVAISTMPVVCDDTNNFGLNSSEYSSLDKGELILRKSEVKGAPWPEVMVFGKIDATPEESTSVFFAYHHHKEFIPNMIVSEPVKYISPVNIHIKFEMKLTWPIPNSKFVTGNKLSKFGKGGYMIEWYFVSSSDTKDTNGDVLFLPYKNGTLFVYRSFVYPKNSAAKFFTSKMIKGVLKSVQTIIDRTEFIKFRYTSRMKKYVSNLESALMGKYIYKKIPGAGN